LISANPSSIFLESLSISDSPSPPNNGANVVKSIPTPAVAGNKLNKSPTAVKIYATSSFPTESYKEAPAFPIFFALLNAPLIYAFVNLFFFFFFLFWLLT